MSRSSRAASAISAMNTYASRNAVMKKSMTRRLSPMSVVKMRLSGQAITKSRKGKPSATGLTGSLRPAADIRKYSPNSPAAPRSA